MIYIFIFLRSKIRMILNFELPDASISIQTNSTRWRPVVTTEPFDSGMSGTRNYLSPYVPTTRIGFGPSNTTNSMIRYESVTALKTKLYILIDYNILRIHYLFLPGSY